MTQPSFANWLETPLGADVYHRITHNRHAVPLSQYIARWQTIEDIQQEALIYLMQKYEQHGFSKILAFAKDDDHAAAMMTRLSVMHCSNKYCRRRRIEDVLPEETEPCQFEGSQATDNLRRTNQIDHRIDLERAQVATIQALESNRLYRARSDIALTTRTILFAEAHLENGRYGEMVEYCQAQGVGALVQRWKPRIIAQMKVELAAYAPPCRTSARSSVTD
jgi:hypothetical protein